MDANVKLQAAREIFPFSAVSVKVLKSRESVTGPGSSLDRLHLGDVREKRLKVEIL